MIVSSEGKAVVRTSNEAVATMIVSTTGTAYTKKGVVKSVMRFFKKSYRFVKTVFVELKQVIVKLCTKNGKPHSIEPPGMDGVGT